MREFVRLRAAHPGRIHAIIGNHIHARVAGNARVSAGSARRKARTTLVEIRPADE